MILSEEKFSVDFEAAWQWVGYSTKGNAKRVLEANFSKGTDFEVLIRTDKNPEGGRPGEYIRLSTDCFKSFCMMSGTQRGKEVRAYFLDCEKELFSRRKAEASTSSAKLCLQMAQTLVDHEGRLDRIDVDLGRVKARLAKTLPESFELQLVSPTQLGKSFEPVKSGRDINRLLCAHGFQWWVGGEWVPTSRGGEYSLAEAVELGNGKVIYQIKWQRRVASMLEAV